MTSDGTRIVLYSHDSLGMGHTRRNLAVSHRLAMDLPNIVRTPVTGLLLTGITPQAGTRAPEGFDWLILPGFAKTPSGYLPRRLRTDPQTLVRLRLRVVAAALQGFEPDLVIVDRHPLGVHRELEAPLRLLRTRVPHAKVVLGLREVLDDPAAAAAEWQALGSPDALRRLIDAVWIYGDPSVHDPVVSGEIPSALHERTAFTGYLARGRQLLDPDPGPPSKPYVLTTAGGGSDGLPLLRAAVAMAPPPGHRHLVVTGPQLREDALAGLRSSARPGVVVHRYLPGLSHLIARASAVIAMGGYNTACELMTSTTPALIVPREHPRREQFIRARALERAGAVDVLTQGELSTDQLANWTARAVSRTVSRDHLDREGLRRTARLAADLLGDPSSAAPTQSARASKEKRS